MFVFLKQETFLVISHGKYSAESPIKINDVDYRLVKQKNLIIYLADLNGDFSEIMEQYTLFFNP